MPFKSYFLWAKNGQRIREPINPVLEVNQPLRSNNDSDIFLIKEDIWDMKVAVFVDDLVALESVVGRNEQFPEIGSFVYFQFQN